jgi:hypothetical protein
MYIKNQHIIKMAAVSSFLMIAILLLAACNSVPAAVTQTSSTSLPELKPGTPGKPERTLQDTNTSFSAAAKHATTGDNILRNLYERPFSQDMTYQPDVDIITVDFASDTNFFYFTITLQGQNPTTKSLTATYGIEFDRSKTGRGDLLVWVKDVQKDWSSSNLTVFTDPDGDVGGPKPITADANFKGNGYEKTETMGGDKVAYARLSPTNQAVIQIAVSRVLLGSPNSFLWGAWADNGIKNPALFDYDDHFGPGVAGSPIVGSDYPLKALYSLDNTCREPFGFSPSGNIPGLCISAPPVAAPAGQNPPPPAQCGCPPAPGCPVC